MAKTLKPLYDRVVIKRLDVTDTTRHGLIYIPDTAKEKPQEGIVVSAGLAATVKQGERVLFGKYSGSEIKIDGEELLIMKEEEILGVIDVRQ